MSFKPHFRRESKHLVGPSGHIIYVCIVVVPNVRHAIMSSWKAVEYSTAILKVNICVSVAATVGLFDIDLSC